MLQTRSTIEGVAFGFMLVWTAKFAYETAGLFGLFLFVILSTMFAIL